jgi:hypothetical protein
MVLEGQVVAFTTLILFSVIIILYLLWHKRGKPLPQMRALAGLDAIPEAIGRATEMGRPVHFSPGDHAAYLSQAESGPQTIAALSVLGYTARLAARNDVPILVTYGTSEIYPLIYEILSTAYIAEGKPMAFKPENIFFAPGYSYGIRCMGIIEREKPAAAIMLGIYYYDGLLINAAGNAAGAFQIAGSAFVTELPFFMTLSDYVLIGEEVYAAGAYVDKDVAVLGCLHGQDIVKYIVCLVAVVGSILATAGIPIVSWLTM